MISCVIISIKYTLIWIHSLEYSLRMVSSLTLHSYMWVHFGNIYLVSFEIGLIFNFNLLSCCHHIPYYHFIICQWTWSLSVSYTHINPSKVHHFITHILGSLTFERILDLLVYKHKPWGFIRRLLSDSYIPKTM